MRLNPNLIPQILLEKRLKMARKCLAHPEFVGQATAWIAAMELGICTPWTKDDDRRWRSFLYQAKKGGAL